MTFKYLKKVNDTCWLLDHRLCPEVSAMMSAMSSRLPAGGIEQRYREVVEAVADDIANNSLLATDREGYLRAAEERLTEYPLHPVALGFFRKYVGEYGHSSPLELVGQPGVYVQGVSPWTAYLSFDNPLVAGQEFSTRAVRHKDWPMCREALAYEPDPVLIHEAANKAKDFFELHRTVPFTQPIPHPELEALHGALLEVFEAEVDAWKAYFKDPENRKKHGIKDKEPFRPALDRARWAIPSTIATGFCHTANTRVMGRVIQQGMDFSAKTKKCSDCNGVGAYVNWDDEGNSTLPCEYCGSRGTWTEQSQVWQDIKEVYEEALPGMKGMWLREAVVGTERQLPAHLQIGFNPPGEEVDLRVIWATSSLSEFLEQAKSLPRRKPRGYLDPTWNSIARVRIEFQCSWAVARDWHRHRTAFPWHLNIIGEPDAEDPASFALHGAYKPLSSLATEEDHEVEWGPDKKYRVLLAQSFDLFEKFRDAGDMEKAMLCIPFGTLVSMRTTMGLRDAVYMLELRANAHGANFEYEAQAREALKQLKEQLGEELAEVIFPEEA